ncbi:NAD(P)H-binding protein [Streptomyces sp. NPDC051940]|uniref:NAD(P)H-binding protein n=1 Tax=Streptomyces sp. NPDC051940 TaxID=3155675 RepID=UPI003420D8D6
MILVTGAGGNVGREVVRELTAAGAPVRALSRDGGADLNEPASLRPALDGVRAVFLLPGFRDMPGLVAEFKGAGVERVVLLSGQAAVATDTGNAISRYMLRSETAVRESGLDWTFLRPAAFMSNTLRWLPQLTAGDVVRDAFGELPIATVDPADIAAVAATALLEPGHAGRAYALTGPQALRPGDRVRLLGEVLGRALRFEGWSDEEGWARMAENTPLEYVEAFFAFYRDHTIDETTVHPTVEQITGRPPRTFTQWATAHADGFRA